MLPGQHTSNTNQKGLVETPLTNLSRKIPENPILGYKSNANFRRCTVAEVIANFRRTTTTVAQVHCAAGQAMQPCGREVG